MIRYQHNDVAGGMDASVNWTIAHADKADAFASGPLGTNSNLNNNQHYQEKIA